MAKRREPRAWDVDNETSKEQKQKQVLQFCITVDVIAIFQWEVKEIEIM